MGVKQIAESIISSDPQAGSINAFLDQGCEFEGKMTFQGEVRIQGHFKGEIFSDDTLIIGEGAEVEANLEVGELILQGKLCGNVSAKKRVELKAPAQMTGDIRCPQLFVEEGVVLNGQCFMGEHAVQTQPTPEEAIAS